MSFDPECPENVWKNGKITNTFTMVPIKSFQKPTIFYRENQIARYNIFVNLNSHRNRSTSTMYDVCAKSICFNLVPVDETSKSNTLIFNRNYIFNILKILETHANHQPDGIRMSKYPFAIYLCYKKSVRFNG